MKKNLGLSEEFMSYIIANKIKMQSNRSYVFFSPYDKKLNKLNERLIDGLIKDGKKVVRVEKTKNSANPWKFMSVQ